MARGGRRPGAGRKPKPRPPTPDEVREAADRAEGLGGDGADDTDGASPRGRGAPSKYQDLFARQAAKLVVQGATDADLASFFEVDVRTIYRWKHDHPDFCQSLTRGKDVADATVEASLFRRATGYSHDATKIMQYEGQPVVVPYVEHYPPDTTAAIFWLKNRRPDQWRDKPAGEGGTPADLARDIEQARAAMAQVEGRET